ASSSAKARPPCWSRIRRLPPPRPTVWWSCARAVLRPTMADAALGVGVARATLGGFAAGQGARGRALLAVLAIALGVALGFAVQLINHTAIGEFTSGLATLSGDADLTVQGGRAGFAETIYPMLAR